MLHRTTSTSAWWPGRWPAWQRGVRTGLNSALVRYLLILVAVCALGCVYLWEANNLSQLYGEISRKERQIYMLEAENIRLAEQSAQWNAPGHVEQRMRAEGFVNAHSVIYAQFPAAAFQPGFAALPQIAQSPRTQ